MKSKSETFGPLVSDEQRKANIGFVYYIEVDGLRYIGKKNFLAKKGKVYVESDWKTYASSSDLIKDKLKSHVGEFKILEFAHTKRELTYLEVKYQMKNDVLESDEWANKNIMFRFYKNVRD